MRGIAKVCVILKTCENIQFTMDYNFVSDIFARINENLILKNKNENDILKLIINFKEH